MERLKKIMVFLFSPFCDYDDNKNFKVSMGRLAFWIYFVLMCRNTFILNQKIDELAIYTFIALLMYNSGNKGKEVLVKLIENWKK